ncbi:hypothetical protein PGT21_009407 [Puccinia graminis f. sp. tritici]|uniref:Uncharacterized protein n=1 Tax=Puccinia graminis f. sp. tritici TaxID=56615 RepID=A0A5B0QI04_PUCGR|nr:hypothetical protein PGT21_009407 [Puccinia graminis f. sp. tritici]
MDCHSGGQPPSLLIHNPVLVNLALKLLGADGVSDDFACSSQHDSLYPKVQLALQQVTAPKGSLIVIANEGDTGLSLDRRRLHSDLESLKRSIACKVF